MLRFRATAADVEISADKREMKNRNEAEQSSNEILSLDERGEII